MVYESETCGGRHESGKSSGQLMASHPDELFKNVEWRFPIFANL
ncbi:Uncharacterised protein [Yersinia similis]|uniref:Uncharacterized protein n=1 Tax=Yersinia similis TaxID=367190 RepID=A0A0T9QJS5_9GAMM|nr:Uncharacterised protein [Yersinia similis]CNB58983.1 Uncharacterised protein [Yersinia similis]CNE97346.1 Uncharacterised protein [Yersinia similis]CNF00236.1 Uncharacterised protein [Yersinia similis]CNI14991.1 Uncharacterised protein [Yersinia similis]